jgi:single stranded DNA-binding protein
VLLHRLRTHPPESSGHAAADPHADALRPAAGDDADLNRVHLTGTLGTEPLLYDVGDHPVAALALACQRRWRATSGAFQVETTWLNLVATDEIAEHCGRLFHRGDRVYVEGSLRLWTEVRGPHHYGCHTVVLDRIVLLAARRCDGEGA